MTRVEQTRPQTVRERRERDRAVARRAKPVRRCPWGHEVRRPPVGEWRCYCVPCGRWYGLAETHER